MDRTVDILHVLEIDQSTTAPDFGQLRKIPRYSNASHLAQSSYEF